jgi:hypothetical protein
MGKWSIAPLILNPALYGAECLGEESAVPIVYEFLSQSLSGRCREEKTLLLLPEIEP